MGKWRAKVRSFDRCTRCRRTSPPQASDAFSSSVRREGANNTTPVLVAPPFSHSAGAAAGEAAKGEPATDGRTSGLFLPPSLPLSQDPYPATDLAVDLTVSYCSSRPSLPISRRPPAPSALLIQLLPLMEGQERRGKKGEREREESPKTQTKLLPTD